MSPVLYVLTGLTGRRAREQRVVPFATFDATPRTWAAIAAALATFLVGTLLGWPLLGPLALPASAVLAAVVAAAMTVRSRQGTKRLWVTAQMDRRRSATGTFFLCGADVDPDQCDLVWFSKNTVPVPSRTGVRAPAAPRPVRAVPVVTGADAW